MHNKRITDSLIRVIEDQLNIFSVSSSLTRIVKRQLTISTGGLYLYNPPFVLLVPITIYRALTGKYKLALPATASLIFFKAAADIFDDLEDEDNPASLSATSGKAIANNTATSMLILAEKTLSHQLWIEDSVKVKVIQCINHYYSLSCLGQHMDLSLLPGQVLSEDEFLNIVYYKSAVTIECAVRTGAILSEANPSCLENLTKFGYYLGMAAQLNNDIKGILDNSDIKTKKITLPWIFALRASDTQSKYILKEYLYNNSKTVEIESIKNLLFSNGAIQYSLYKSEFYKQLAFDALEKTNLSNKVVNRLRSIF